jgi:hypothetical protein
VDDCDGVNTTRGATNSSLRSSKRNARDDSFPPPVLVSNARIVNFAVWSTWYGPPTFAAAGIYHVTSLTGDTFSLQAPENNGDIDSTGFAAYTSGGTAQVVKKTIDGLTHLEAEECGVLADGGVHPVRTPNASGEITLQSYHNVVQVGLAYTVDIEPVPIEPLEAAGRTGNLARIRLKVHDTLNAQAGPDSDNLTQIIDGPTTYSTPPPLFTGVKKVTISGNYACPATLLIRQSDPLPIRILGFACDVDINDVV